GIKRHRGSAVFASVTAFLLLAALMYSFNFTKGGGGGAIDSLAVLPFDNAGGDPETEYLSDGISDSVLNSLSRLPNMRVISHNTVFRYKGRQVDPQAVGRELNVGAVLMGRVAQRGDALAISVELVDVSDNRRLWGEQYHPKQSDILAVQEEIVGQIAEKLRPRLGDPDKQRLTKRYTENADAYHAFLKGRYLLDKRTGPTTEKSIEYFEQAIKLDSNYAPAYAGLGYAYMSLGTLAVRSQKEVIPKANEAVAKALELDDTLAEAHTALGYIKLFEWDWTGSERAFKRGIELNPNSGYAHDTYAFFLRAVRRFDEAVAESKLAAELEPTSAVFNKDLAMMLYSARRYDEVIEQCHKALELNPNMHVVYWWLHRAYRQKGLYEQAIEAELKGRDLEEPRPETATALKEAYAVSGWKGYLQKDLDLEKARAKQTYINPFGFAELYAQLGDKDQTFAWLEKSQEVHELQITTLNGDPIFDELRSDPRYHHLLRRMNLEP
ncbi:MAG TPA: hypothetical protein VNI02_10460, partial [Blastocatellia bacterium]|nr:hypothetical protein [Blastocatellia bacterium]